MVAPIPRTHIPVKYPGEGLFVIAKECMEQLYDDNTDGKFGTVDFLSFNRLHHLNLHYFEFELATELEKVVKEDAEPTCEDVLQVRKLLREYSMFFFVYHDNTCLLINFS